MRKRRIKLFTLISINVILLVSAFLLNISKASTNYLTYDGNKNSASAINNFINECYSAGKDAYFDKGTYTLDGNINLKNGVSLLGVDNETVFKATNQAYIYTTTGNTSNITIDGFLFDNVTVFVRDLNCENFVISNNIFMNAKNADQNVDSGMRSNTGYYVLIKHNAANIKSNIFLRDKNSLGRGIALYKSNNCVIEDNYFGIIEDLSTSIVSEVVKNKYQTIINYPNLNKTSNQGYFMTAINVLSEDINVMIKGNHISLNDDITESTNVNNDASYHRDHLIYAKEFDGLHIIANYVKGSNKNADGGIKVRNGKNATIYKNVLEDSHLLLYIQDASSCSYLKNVYVDSNVFINNYHNSITVNAGIANIKTKNISDNWLIYLRSYSKYYEWDNISIIGNVSISMELGNEKMFIYRGTGNSECPMPMNFNFYGNKELLNNDWSITGHDNSGLEKTEEIKTENVYVPSMDVGLKELDITNLWKKEVDLLLGAQEIIIPENSEIYLLGATITKYTGEKLEPGKYDVIVKEKGSKSILVEGVKTEDFETISCKFATVTVEVHVHEFSDEFTIDIEPTCTEWGEKSRHCLTLGCEGKTDIHQISPMHTMVEFQEKHATCTENGNVPYRHCTVCEKNFSLNGDELENVIIYANHGLMHEVGKEATCESDGVLEHEHCIICGKNFDNSGNELSTVVIPGGHSFMSVPAKNPTCAKPGNIQHKHCIVCGLNFDLNNNVLDNVFITADHTLINIEEIKATCTQTGNIAYKYCTTCGGSYDEVGNLLNYEDTIIQPSHNYVFVSGVEPTCTKEGVVAHKQCTICNKTFDYAHNPISNITIAKSEHQYGMYLKDDKTHWKECSVCKTSTDKINHKYSENIIKQPTSSEEGIKELVCECGDKHIETLPKTDDTIINIGCLGSITTSILAVVLLTGMVIVFKKKKEE